MPTQIQLQFEAQDQGASQNEKLRAYFLARPDRWIPMPELATASGSLNVHSRIANLRHRFGMHIDQKSTHCPGSRTNFSFYRYVPPAHSPLTTDH
jgi:hypothetical protein